MKAFPRRLPAAVVLLQQGCIVVPRTSESYDVDCRVSTHHMELQAVQVATLQHCVNDACAAWLVAAGATVVASAVVSGSIVVVGNIAYWFEKQGRCQRSD